MHKKKMPRRIITIKLIISFLNFKFLIGQWTGERQESHNRFELKLI